MTADVRAERRRGYCAHLAFGYATGAPAVYLGVGDSTRVTLDRVVPEVSDDE
jgi:hypothetical protein